MEHQPHISLDCTTQHKQVRCENHDPAEERPLGELFHRVCAVTLVAVASVDALHVRLPIIDPIGQRAFEQCLDLDILDWAALHGKQVILFVHKAPVDHNAARAL